ncbi:hypothetical protein LMG22037_06323 [Paraburkholderia phenoliruptrix]|uniref:Biotin carboxylase n=1 Tax=Paraburkholderia phenoliruptrix TaxID=252970 RepID=A0A6J5CL20_9BURK|nr:hypothetical protein LMG22037_06323 [Paraburkholderia phenoliruptrix]
MEPSALSPAAIPPLPVVLVHLEECSTARAGHEVGTLRELARQIAEVKGTRVTGEFDPTLTDAAHRCLVPDHTLTLTEAHRLGLRSVCDLFGGVVPFPFVATKLIAHPLTEDARLAPPGWSRAFGEHTASLVLPGYSAFSHDDACNAARRLWRDGPARIKRPSGIGGAGQLLVGNRDELETELAALGEQALRTEGIVVERNLDPIETLSVGQVTLDEQIGRDREKHSLRFVPARVDASAMHPRNLPCNVGPETFYHIPSRMAASRRVTFAWQLDSGVCYG